MSDLRAMALAATPGPWTAGGKSVRAEETEDRLGMDVRLYGGNPDDNRRNSRYIAACSPDRILALLDVADAARRYFNGYVQDEAADGESLDKGWPEDRLYSGCSCQQAMDALALRAALAALGEAK